MKTKFLVIFSILFLISGNVIAEEFELYDVWSYDIKSSVGLVYMYDLDGDGTEEIIAASDKIHVLNKDGTLKAKSIKKIDKISELQIMDLDNDGFNEIVIVAANQPYLLDRDLIIRKESRDVGLVGEVSIENLIDDEKLEVVVGGNKVYIFDSDLQHPLIYDVNGSVLDIYIDDFDNDGQNEIISAGNNGIYMIDNLSTPSPTPRDDVKRINNNIPNIRNIYVSDLDKDKVNDILLGTFFNAYGINKDSNYDKAVEYRTRGEVYDLKVVDLLGDDGKNEVVIGATTDIEFAEFVYVFDIFGKVEWNYPIGRFNTGKEVTIVEVSDLNNDGHKEVIAGSDNTIHILDDKGKLIRNYKAGGKINSIYISDFNNDSYKEIVAGSLDGKVYVLGAKKKEEEIEKNETGKILIENITKIYIYDLNNDGKNEIAVGHPKYVSIRDRDFKLIFNYPTKGAVNGIYIGDIDNDTYNEIVVSDHFGNVYKIGRTGHLIAEEQTNAKITDMYSADLYNDGSYETIIATSKDDREYNVLCTETCCPPVKYLGVILEVDRERFPSPPEGWKGDGFCIISGFEEIELLSKNFTVSFNSDREYETYIENNLSANISEVGKKRDRIGGNLTINVTFREKLIRTIQTAYERGRVHINGSVRALDGKTEKWRYELDSTVRTVFAADINNDNYSEIIAGADDGNVYIIDNNGSLIKKYETEGAIRSVFAADINNDNYSEIIAGSDDWSVHVFNFNVNESIWKYDTGNIVYGVFAADLNNDGITELIVGSHNNYIYIFDSEMNIISKNKTGENIREIYAANVDNDNYKEIVLVGEKLSVLNFDYMPPEIPEEILELNITGIDVTDLVLTSASGERIGLWDKTAGGNSTDNGYGVAVDSDNNIIVTGVTKSFGMGYGDIWMIKYDSSGNLLWSKTEGGVYDDVGRGVAVDSDNNIIVTGGTNSSIAGDWNFWTIKYDPDGNMLWNKTAGGIGDDWGLRVAVDSNNNIIVNGLMEFSEEDYNIWTIKYDPDGDMLWNKTAGGSEEDAGYGVAVDSDNNIIITGFTNSSGEGGMDVWTIKYDSFGNRLWEKTAGGSSDDWGRGVAVDSNNSIIITGGTESFGAGGMDVWVIKYDSNGNVLWNKTSGGSSDDLGNNIAVNPVDNIIVTGVTKSFGAGDEDVLIILYYPNGSMIWSGTLGGSSNDSGLGVAVDSENNMIITGYTNSFGAGDSDVWTIKTAQPGLEVFTAPEKSIREKLMNMLKEDPVMIFEVIIGFLLITSAAFFIYKRRKAKKEKKESE